MAATITINIYNLMGNVLKLSLEDTHNESVSDVYYKYFKAGTVIGLWSESDSDYEEHVINKNGIYRCAGSGDNYNYCVLIFEGKFAISANGDEAATGTVIASTNYTEDASVNVYQIGGSIKNIMEVLFNSLGVVTATDFSNANLRQGTIGLELLAYFDSVDNVNFTATLNFTRSDGNSVGNLIMTMDSDNPECYKYKFVDPWFFAKAGRTTLSIYLRDSNGNVTAQGQVVFNIEVTDYNVDPEISVTQYNELVAAMTGKILTGSNTIVVLSSLPETTGYDNGQVIEVVNSGENEFYQLRDGAWVLLFNFQNVYSKTETNTLLDEKVDKVSGKSLSTNDFTDADKTKLDGIETGAEVNTIEGVQVDGVDLTPDGNKKVNVVISGKADKNGPLPYFSISQYRNLKSFLDEQNAWNKVCIFYFTGLGESYIGRFSYDAEYLRFEVEEIGGNSPKHRYSKMIPISSLNFTALVFNDLLNNSNLEEYEITKNKVTSLSSSSTNISYPSAKCVYDNVKALSDRITNVENLGRYLSLWNASTGEAVSNPPTSPYTYKDGDYFRVSTGGTKIPNGSSYTIGGTNYTTSQVTLGVGDVVYYDGSVWQIQTAGSSGQVVDVQANGASVVAAGIANITKASLGLENVVNTGDSATPVSGGTTKFTTGGAYTELNKKIDKSVMTAAGDIIVGGSSGTPTRLAKGNNDTELTINNSGNVAWQQRPHIYKHIVQYTSAPSNLDSSARVLIYSNRKEPYTAADLTDSNFSIMTDILAVFIWNMTSLTGYYKYPVISANFYGTGVLFQYFTNSSNETAKTATFSGGIVSDTVTEYI